METSTSRRWPPLGALGSQQAVKMVLSVLCDATARHDGASGRDPPAALTALVKAQGSAGAAGPSVCALPSESQVWAGGPPRAPEHLHRLVGLGRRSRLRRCCFHFHLLLGRGCLPDLDDTPVADGRQEAPVRAEQRRVAACGRHARRPLESPRRTSPHVSPDGSSAATGMKGR